MKDDMEIAPGEFKLMLDCTAEDLHASIALSEQKMALMKQTGSIIEDMRERAKRAQDDKLKYLAYTPAWERVKAFEERVSEVHGNIAVIPLADFERALEDAKDVRMHSRVGK